MQGGAGEGGLALTAYVLIALLEAPNQVLNDKARIYLETHLSDARNDPYALAVISYALHLANSPKKANFIQFNVYFFARIVFRKLFILA